MEPGLLLVFDLEGELDLHADRRFGGDSGASGTQWPHALRALDRVALRCQAGGSTTEDSP